MCDSSAARLCRLPAHHTVLLIPPITARAALTALHAERVPLPPILAEFYGREYVLFEGGTINNQAGGAPAHLSDLLAGVEPAKRRAVMTHMSQGLVPIMEKGLVDPPLVHRCDCVCLFFLSRGRGGVRKDGVAGQELRGRPCSYRAERAL